MPFTIVYTTHPDMKTAKAIAQGLLDQQLIACANFFSGESMYRWEGKMVDEKEIVALFKTSSDKTAAVEEYIRKEHPYDTPCIITLPVSANEKYEQWIASCTRKS